MDKIPLCLFPLRRGVNEDASKRSNNERGGANFFFATAWFRMVPTACRGWPTPWTIAGRGGAGEMAGVDRGERGGPGQPSGRRRRYFGDEWGLGLWGLVDISN